MIYISHRGNLNGPNKELENNPSYIEKALLLGYDVEIDVWYLDNNIFLGHDKPQYSIDISFLKNPKIWCHAKNIEALSLFIKHKDFITFFWHQSDDYIITSNGYIWTYPGKQLTENSICVLPEKIHQDYDICAGICSDYISDYRFKN